MTASWVAPSLAMAGRSVRGLFRQPQVVAPGLVFPLFFAAVNSAALDRARNLPGFPEVDSYLSFLLAATLLQGVMFSSTSAGTDLALDIEQGFFDRLVVAPVHRLSLIAGRLAGAALYGFLMALVFCGVMVLFGASIQSGFAGLLVLAIVASLFSVAVGGFAVMIALRTGSVEQVNGFFPIFFTLVFLSSAFFPPELTGGWFETVAGLNPVSWIINGLRHLVIFGWDWPGALQAIGVTAGLAAVCVAASLAALRSRLDA